MSWPRLEVVKVVTVFDTNENREKECEGLGEITERKGFKNQFLTSSSIPAKASSGMALCSRIMSTCCLQTVLGYRARWPGHVWGSSELWLCSIQMKIEGRSVK